MLRITTRCASITLWGHASKGVKYSPKTHATQYIPNTCGLARPARQTWPGQPGRPGPARPGPAQLGPTPRGAAQLGPSRLAPLGRARLGWARPGRTSSGSSVKSRRHEAEPLNCIRWHTYLQMKYMSLLRYMCTLAYIYIQFSGSASCRRLFHKAA